MNISKIKIVVKYLTGGVTSVVEYLLDIFNGMVAKLPIAEVAKYAQLAKDISVFVGNVANLLVKNEAKKAAAKTTAAAFDTLATALLDSKLEPDELDAIIASVKEAVEAWKKAK